MLQYDDSAFYYFFLACMLCYLLPATLYSCHTVVTALFYGDSAKKATGGSKKGQKRLLTPCFVIHALVVMALWALFFYINSILATTNGGEIASFDPYQILGLEPGDDTAVIKKAYRKLSLKFHPDRNQGDPVAAETFMRISKAHDALTDDEARENYEKYGNPDGRQALSVSIGLPTFFLHAENHTLILIVYLVVLVIAVPTVVGLWWSHSNQYTQNDVMTRTYQVYMRFMTENISIKGLPEMLGASQEFVTIKHSKQSEALVQKHYKAMIRERSMNKPRRYGPKLAERDLLAMSIFCNNVLIQAHVLRRDSLFENKNARRNLNTILLKTPKLIETMVFMTTVPGRRFWLNQTIQVIKFSQFMTQGLWQKDSSLLQLPHFTNKEAAHCKRGKKGKKSNTMRDFILQAEEDRKGLAKGFTEEMKADVNKVCKQMSNFSVKIVASVEDETQIATNDLVTVEIEVTRLNVAEGEDVPTVYAPRYPEPKEEGIWVILGSPNGRNMLCMPVKLSDQDRVVKTTAKFRAPPKAGTYKSIVYVMSDSYIGLDVTKELVYVVVSEDQLPKYEVHPEDLALDDQPTLFAQMMEGDLFEDTDSESDEDEGTGNDDGMTAAQRKRRRERIQRKSGDSKGEDGKDGDSSDDGEGEGEASGDDDSDSDE